MFEFDAQRAFQYAKSISRPRLVGSEGERYAAQYLVERFESFGLEVSEEEFLFSTGWETAQNLVFIGLALLLSVSFFTYKTYPRLAGVLSIFVLIGALSFQLIVRNMLSLSVANDHSSKQWLSRILFWLGDDLKSQNIIARFKPVGTEEVRDRPAVYVLAHYDSKSQGVGIPLVVRIGVVVIAILGAVAISLLFVLLGLKPEITSGRWTGLAITALYLLTMACAVFIFFFRGTTNKSAGAIDNASGVGVLLHLAEIIAQQKEITGKLDFTFVATGAEEFGLMGAFAFYQTHKRAFKQRNGNVYFLNFDGPGTNGNIYAISGIGLVPEFARGNSNLKSIIRIASEEQNLRVRSLAVVVGAMFDHFPFRMGGFDALSLTIISAKALSVVHSPKDTVEQLDLEGFDEVGRLACAAIERMAS